MTLEGKETENEEFWTKNYENKTIIKIKTIEKLKKKIPKKIQHMNLAFLIPIWFYHRITYPTKTPSNLW